MSRTDRYTNGTDETTGITIFQDEAEETEETAATHWYELNGRRIHQPTRCGVYILNNKKVLIK